MALTNDAFEEFLQERGMTTADYSALKEDNPLKKYCRDLFFFNLAHFSENYKTIVLGEGAEAEHTIPLDLQRTRQREARYQEWEEYFDKNIDNIVDKNVLVTSMLEAATVAATEKLKQEAEWSRQIALNAVRRGTTDPEKLVFAEAKEMERSKQWEAMHRCLPMGNDFAGWLELAKETAQIEEIPLSEAMKRMDPASPLINMYSHLLKKVDNIPGVMEMDHKDVIKEVYKYSPDSYSDYNSHLEDDEPFANPDNVDHAMKEMFRLGERMSRNSRMSGPMKELCGKINGLKNAYMEHPEKYQEMPRSYLKNLMSSVMGSADAYLKDKSTMKSFSSTQLERLKCINQLKSIQDTFVRSVGKKESCYDMEGSHLTNPGKKNGYIALAEKMVLNMQIQSGSGAAMCDRRLMQKQVKELAANPNFYKYANSLTSAIQKRHEGDSSFTLKDAYNEALKGKGKTLLAQYKTFAKAMENKPNVAVRENQISAPQKAMQKGDMTR